MEVCEFGEPGPLRDRLIAAVLSGTKTATSSLLADWLAESTALPQPGSRQSIVDSSEMPVAVIEILSVEVVALGAVTDEHAAEEGEGFVSVDDWRTAHERFWADVSETSSSVSVRMRDDTDVVLERFRLVSGGRDDLWSCGAAET